MMYVVEVGDFVQARKVTPQGVIPLEFTVSSVDGAVVGGSPLGALDPADGWSIELCRKGDPSLPAELSVLAVWTVQERTVPVRAVGPIDGTWQTDAGGRVRAVDVLAWTPWGEYIQEAT